MQVTKNSEHCSCISCMLPTTRTLFLDYLQLLATLFFPLCTVFCNCIHMQKPKFTMFLLSVWRKAKQPSSCCSWSAVWGMHVIQQRKFNTFSFSLLTQYLLCLVQYLLCLIFLCVMCLRISCLKISFVSCVYLHICSSRSWELITTLFLPFLKPLYSITLCTVLRTSLQEKPTKTKVEQIQTKSGGWCTWYMKSGEGAVLVWAGEEKAKGRFNCCLPFGNGWLQRRQKQTILGDVLWKDEK